MPGAAHLPGGMGSGGVPTAPLADQFSLVGRGQCHPVPEFWPHASVQRYEAALWCPPAGVPVALPGATFLLLPHHLCSAAPADGQGEESAAGHPGSAGHLGYIHLLLHAKLHHWCGCTPLGP